MSHSQLDTLAEQLDEGLFDGLLEQGLKMFESCLAEQNAKGMNLAQRINWIRDTLEEQFDCYPATAFYIKRFLMDIDEQEVMDDSLWYYSKEHLYYDFLINVSTVYETEGL